MKHTCYPQVVVNCDANKSQLFSSNSMQNIKHNIKTYTRIGEQYLYIRFTYNISIEHTMTYIKIPTSS